MDKYYLAGDARDDLRRIIDFIAEDGIEAALGVYGRFLDVFEMLGDNPKAGHFRADLTDRPLRFFPLFSYMIIYLDGTMPVQVVRILSASRDLAVLLDG